MDLPTFSQWISSIAQYTKQSSKFHLHKGHLAQILKLSAIEGFDNLLLCVESRCSMSKTDDTCVANLKPYDYLVDLKDNAVNNLTRLHYQSPGTQCSYAAF